MRNSDRWRVTAIDPNTGRIPVERLTDRARAVFDTDYASEYVTHGYATTVHSAQGVTADTTHAVLGENTTRSMLYVAMTRARDANNAYLYEQTSEHEYGPNPSDGPHVLQRGTGLQAVRLASAILASRDDVPVTAHDIAAGTPHQLLPEVVARLLTRRNTAVEGRQATHSVGRKPWTGWGAMVSLSRARARAADRSRILDRNNGMEL